jgi:hypothetical protein
MNFSSALNTVLDLIQIRRKNKMIEVSNQWSTLEAIALIRSLEPLAAKCGYHLALTGGLLYKDGPRKDADIVIYRVRQELKSAERLARMFTMFESVGVSFADCYDNSAQWIRKATFNGKQIDFFYPEAGFGSYPEAGLPIARFPLP